jgi:hypothetical protein
MMEIHNVTRLEWERARNKEKKPPDVRHRVRCANIAYEALSHGGNWDGGWFQLGSAIFGGRIKVGRGLVPITFWTLIPFKFRGRMKLKI